ncbi:MAG: helix-turn-helix domain-containing protein [Methanomassiliicoccales archaeon]|nr:MAG: helix-turn-helix domain-containing protein [Methanomassiliicoccales archaeon]
MTIVSELIDSIIESDDAFRETLKRTLKTELGMSIPEFSKKSGVSQSTIYKIISEKREPNLRTLRQIITAIRKIEGLKGEPFIAVIVARSVLNKIEERRIKIRGKEITIREYPANSMEETIISAVFAERDGAQAVVCAPIVSTTIEKILRIPVATIMPKDSMIEAIELAAKKTGN